MNTGLDKFFDNLSEIKSFLIEAEKMRLSFIISKGQLKDISKQ
jgi:hypothetical protein